jgi:type IV secretory pathway VirB4 component
MLNLVNIHRFLRRYKFRQYLGDVLLFYDFFQAPGQDGDGLSLPVVVLKDGTVLSICKLRGLDYENSGRGRIEAAAANMKSLFEQLGPGITMQTYLVRRQAHPDSLEPAVPGRTSPLLDYLKAHRQRFYRELAEQTYENEIYLCLKVEEGPVVSTRFRHLVDHRARFHLVGSALEASIQKLEEAAMLLKVSTKELGLRFLSEEEVFRFLYFLVNFREPAGRLRPDLTLHAQLLRSELTFRRGLLCVNDRTFVSAIPLVDLPSHSYPLLLEGFLRLPGRLILHQFFSPFDFNRYKNRFTSDRKYAESTALKFRESKKWLDHYNGYVDRLHDGSRPLFYSFVLLNIADSPEALKQVESEAMNLLKGINGYGVPETYYLRNTYFSYLPGHQVFNQRRFMILSDNAAHLVNVFALDRGDSRATELFLDRHQGVYRFNLLKPGQPNHTALTGPTGSGKTFLTIQFLLSALLHRPYIFVIDPKRSYYSLFEILKEAFPHETAVFQYGDEAVDFRFNPFWLPDPDKVEEGQVKYTENLLSLMIGKDLINGVGRSLIRQALDTFYFEYASLIKNGHADDPPLSLLYSIFNQKRNCRDIALALKNWTTGERGQILNSGHDRLRFSRFCYFDLRDLEGRGDVLKVIAYLLFHKVKQVIEDDRLLAVSKLLVLEEAAVYLKLEEFRDITGYFIRTGRTNNLILMAVCQSINDLLEFDKQGNILPWSSGILTNLMNIILFGGQKNVDRAFRALDIDEEFSRKYQALNTVNREFLLWQFSGLRRRFRCATDPARYWVATTNPEERQRRSRALEASGRDFARALSYLIDHQDETQQP